MQLSPLGQLLTKLAFCSTTVGIITSVGLPWAIPTVLATNAQDLNQLSAAEDDRGSGRLTAGSRHEAQFNPFPIARYRGSGRITAAALGRADEVEIPLFSWRGSGRLGQDGETA